MNPLKRKMEPHELLPVKTEEDDRPANFPASELGCSSASLPQQDSQEKNQFARSMKDFRSKHQSRFKISGATTDCDLFVPDTPEDRLVVFESSLSKANTVQGDKATCVHVAGVLMTMIGEFRPVLLSTLSNLGINIVERRLPSQAGAAGLDVALEGTMDPPETLVVFGCTVLHLFKNNNPQSYYNYMRNRIRAMKALTGVLPGKEISVPFTLKKANAVRSMLGSSLDLKESVIMFLIEASQRSDNLGSLALYLTNILSWSEMQSFGVIYDTLLLTESAVLEDKRIQHEVINLYEAYEDISKAKYPKFYRYIEGKNSSTKFERNKFPTLVAVAERIKMSNFVNQDNALVDSLVAVHLNHKSDAVKRAINFMTREILRLMTDSAVQVGFLGWELQILL